jgi:hypothetical protein
VSARLSRLAVRATLAALLATTLVVPAIAAGAAAPAAEAPPAPPPPANDKLANAQSVHSLPATLQGTTVGATLEPSEVESGCAGGTTHSVWYSLRSGSAQRIAVDLAAGGALDGTLDVYHVVRSKLLPAGCQATDSHGKASLTFKASKNGVYAIRVAALATSQLAGFTLDVFLPTPAVGPPGPRRCAPA